MNLIELLTGKVGQKLALYVILYITTYLAYAETQLMVMFLFIPLAYFIDRLAYSNGMADGVFVIMSSLTAEERIELAIKMSNIERS